MKKILYISLVITIFSSCIKEVHIPIENKQSKLVLNGLFNTDSLWNVELSVSKYIYDTAAIELVDDAQVIVSDTKGNSFELLNVGEGEYQSLTEKPIIGEVYSIEATHDTHENISSTNQLPSTIEVNEITWDEEVFIEGTLSRKVSINFEDTQEKEFYLIKLSSEVTESFNDPIGGQSESFTMNQDIYFTMQNSPLTDGNSEWMRSLTFSDESFNGTNYTVNLIVDEWYFTNSEDEFFSRKVENVKISISRVSQEYYWYQRSFEAYSSSQGGLFSQPVQVYTNIENGLGVFAGYSATEVSFQIDE